MPAIYAGWQRTRVSGRGGDQTSDMNPALGFNRAYATRILSYTDLRLMWRGGAQWGHSWKDFISHYYRGPSRSEQLSTCRNLVGAHHLVVFMLQDVAMPHILARIAFEARNNSRHHSRMGLHRIFPSRFIGCRWHGGPMYFTFPCV